MASKIQVRRGTAAQWTAANPILIIGELGFETDTNTLFVRATGEINATLDGGFF